VQLKTLLLTAGFAILTLAFVSAGSSKTSSKPSTYQTFGHGRHHYGHYRPGGYGSGHGYQRHYEGPHIFNRKF
jgi:hypothetical protein